MESMTGYAVVEKATEQFSFSIEIKSVNSKYVETYLNLPRFMKDDEYEIELLLKKRYARGKIELSIDIHDWLESRPVMINRDLLRKYYREISAVTEELGPAGGFRSTRSSRWTGWSRRNARAFGKIARRYFLGHRACG